MRIASYAQQSQRYCAYKDTMEFIIPEWSDIEPFEDSLDDWKLDFPEKSHIRYREARWCNSMAASAMDYRDLLESGLRPEQARGVLPNDIKTEINISTNFREWLHIFELRDDSHADPCMRQIMNPFHNEIRHLIPIVFD